MTVLSVKQPTHSLRLLGFVALPINLAPFGSLIFCSIIVPQASFVGHLAGIVMGYLVAWDVFVWVDWYWFAVLAFWTAVVFLFSLKATTNIALPFLQVCVYACACACVRACVRVRVCMRMQCWQYLLTKHTQTLG
jgi:hypothetical protein